MKQRTFSEMRALRESILARFRVDPSPLDLERARTRADEWVLRGGVIQAVEDGQPTGRSISPVHLAEEFRGFFVAREVPRSSPLSEAASSGGGPRKVEVEVVVRVLGEKPVSLRGFVTGLDSFRLRGPDDGEDPERRLVSQFTLRCALPDLPGRPSMWDDIVFSAQVPGLAPPPRKGCWLTIQPWTMVSEDGADAIFEAELAEPIDLMDLPPGPINASDMRVVIQCKRAGASTKATHRNRVARKGVADPVDREWDELKEAAERAPNDPAFREPLADGLFRSCRTLIEWVGRSRGIHEDDLDELVQNVLVGRPWRGRKRDPAEAETESTEWRRGLVDKICAGALKVEAPHQWMAYVNLATVYWSTTMRRERDRRDRLGRPGTAEGLVDVPSPSSGTCEAELADQVTTLESRMRRVRFKAGDDVVIAEDWINRVPKAQTAAQLGKTVTDLDNVLRREIAAAFRSVGVTMDEVRAFRAWVCLRGPAFRFAARSCSDGEQDAVAM